MSRARVERLLNLVIALQAARRPLTVSEIGRLVDGYGAAAADDAAFRRMFERDKEELREQGIPVEVTLQPGGEQGYRIPPRRYALPDLDLDADELAALALAARLWDSAALAGAATLALRKLGAAGAPADLAPQVGASAPALPALLAAIRHRRPVAFDYRGAGAQTAARREVDPWGVVSWHGHWYLVGHDRGRAQERVYRLDRVTGEVRETAGTGTAAPPPAGTDLVAVVRAGARAGAQPGTAVVELAEGSGQALRQRGRPPTGAPPVLGTGPALLEVDYPDGERFASEVAALGAGATVRSPASVREAVIAGLRAVRDAHGSRSAEETP